MYLVPFSYVLPSPPVSSSPCITHSSLHIFPTFSLLAHSLSPLPSFPLFTLSSPRLPLSSLLTPLLSSPQSPSFLLFVFSYSPFFTLLSSPLLIPSSSPLSSTSPLLSSLHLFASPTPSSRPSSLDVNSTDLASSLVHLFFRQLLDLSTSLISEKKREMKRIKKKMKEKE